MANSNFGIDYPCIWYTWGVAGRTQSVRNNDLRNIVNSDHYCGSFACCYHQTSYWRVYLVYLPPIDSHPCSFIHQVCGTQPVLPLIQQVVMSRRFKQTMLPNYYTIQTPSWGWSGAFYTNYSPWRTPNTRTQHMHAYKTHTHARTHTHTYTHTVEWTGAM